MAFTTLPASFDAVGLARDLIGAGLAACVTRVPDVESIYMWNGAIETSREQQLFIKTTQAKLDPLWARLKAQHPYDVPEFVVLPVVGGNEEYLSWIRGVAGSAEGAGPGA